MSKPHDNQDSSSSDTDVSTEEQLTKKPSRWHRLGRNLRKWWWLYLILICCIFLVIFLPIIYIGIPRFANDYINKHELNLDGLTITDPRPNSFHVTHVEKLHLGGGIPGNGHLTAFNTSFRAPGTEKEFAELSFPRLDFDRGESTLDLDQDINLSCVECFSKLAAAAITGEKFEFLVTGRPELKLGAFPTAHLRIHKMVQMTGFKPEDFLKSNGKFKTTHLRIMSPPVNGFNVNATITMRAAIGFTMEMGHVTFNLTLNNSPLGYLDIPNLTLERDQTSVVVLGSIDESILIREFLWGHGDGTEVTIGFKGHGCDYNGVEIPYFAAAVRAIDASATVDLLQYLHLLT